MKPILIILTALCLASCIKEHALVPLTNDLTGVWLSDDKNTQLTIRDTRGNGDFVKTTDITNSSGRYLVVDLNGYVVTYKILSVGKMDMNLMDSISVNIHLNKVGE